MVDFDLVKFNVELFKEGFRGYFEFFDVMEVLYESNDSENSF